ncbi:MAG: hypothetical protein GX605_11075 [Chloroflexi bacterium]|nr:hypothetical protein [Chloroflexota bacterium]
MTDLPLTQWSAGELAQRIARREVSPVEATQAYLERIERYDEQLSAYITLCPEAALQAAREAEQAVMRQAPLGPLHGVPFGVKDQFHTAGLRTTAGSTILADFIPEADATAVARAKAAGAILLGKLNMTEFAAGLGDRFKYGEPRNPWDLTRTAAGSSTGSAIAIAASLCATSLGEDTGGSIRFPAALTGIVGVRPTWGLVSRHGIIPISWSMDAAGPMTRTVEDAAVLLGVVAGYDPQDPLTAQRPVPDYVASLQQGVRGLRIGIIHEWMDESWVNPQVTAGVRGAADVLRQLGATVDEVSLPFLTQIGPAMSVITGAEGYYVARERLRTAPQQFGTHLRRRWQAGALVPAPVLLKAQRVRALHRREWLALFTRCDALIGPTTPEPAEPISYLTDITSSQEAAHRSVWRTSCTMAAALAGTPAMTIPCGFSAEGLPLGLQIMTRPFEDGLMFRIGHAYEGATDWHQRRPALFP